MDPMVWLLKNRYGSLELSRQVGPNMLRGLAGSILLHSLAIAALFATMIWSGTQAPPPVKSWIIPLPPMPRPAPVPPIIHDAPVPKLPDNVLNPIPVDNPDVDATSKPVEPGPVGIPGPVDKPGTGTIGSTDGPSGPIIGDDDVIGEPGTFTAYEFPPSPLDINPQPAYPPIALISKVTGVVNIWVYVDPRGDAKKWQIIKTNPKGLGFDEAVLNVIPKWKFTPALQQGHAVGVWVAIPFKFSVKN